MAALKMNMDEFDDKCNTSRELGWDKNYRVVESSDIAIS